MTPGWIWGSNSSLPCLHNKHCLLSHVSLKIALMFTTWERGGRRLLWDKGSRRTESHSLCGDRGSWLDTLCWGAGKFWIILWLCTSYAHTTTVSTMCTCTAVSWKHHFLVVVYYWRLLQSFCPLFYKDPWALEKVCDIDITFRIKHFVVSYSLNVDQL